MTRELPPTAIRNRNIGTIALVTGSLLTIGAAVTLVALWIALGERGISADTTGTAGYTTTGEAVVGALAFLGVIVGAIAITIGAITLRAAARGNGIRGS